MSYLFSLLIDPEVSLKIEISFAYRVKFIDHPISVISTSNDKRQVISYYFNYYTATSGWDCFVLIFFLMNRLILSWSYLHRLWANSENFCKNDLFYCAYEMKSLLTSFIYIDLLTPNTNFEFK